jgi:predicted nucleic acid-binding protein
VLVYRFDAREPAKRKRSALSADCDRVLTEDLQHGFAFGSLRVENPFR